MSSFSTIACYAALSSCSREDILHAYARMIAALIQRNRYKTCDTDTLCKDFKAYYGFSVPYQPMQTILFTCIKALFNRQANLRRYSAEKVEQAVHQKERAEEKLALIDANLREARKELHQESTKPDRFSADISILQS